MVRSSECRLVRREAIFSLRIRWFSFIVARRSLNRSWVFTSGGLLGGGSSVIISATSSSSSESRSTRAFLAFFVGASRGTSESDEGGDGWRFEYDCDCDSPFNDAWEECAEVVAALRGVIVDNLG